MTLDEVLGKSDEAIAALDSALNASEFCMLRQATKKLREASACVEVLADSLTLTRRVDVRAVDRTD